MVRHKRIRKTDSDKLRAWLDANGAEGWAALMNEGLAAITLERLSKGQLKGVPREVTQRVLCRITGFKLDELFPLVGAGEEEAS